MPEEYKQQLRQMLSDIFECRTSFIVSAMSIKNEITASECDGVLMLHAPITFRDKLCEFFYKEGLSVKNLGKCVFQVSVVC